MPKEITHWLIAEAAAKRCLPSVASAEEQAMARLGAVFHDVLYYVLSNKHLSQTYSKQPKVSNTATKLRCTAIANALHGANGEGTFGIMRQLAAINVADTSPKTQTLSHFALGVLSHICADIAFHPCIYHISGDIHSPKTHFQAWENHRALESALDLAFCAAKGVRPDSVSLQSDIRLCKKSLSALLQNIAELQQKEYDWEITADDYMQGYITLARLRPLFLNKTLNRVVDVFDEMIRFVFAEMYSEQFWVKARSYLALRYLREPRLNVSAFPFRSPVNLQELCEYQHPVTGEFQTTSFYALFEESIAETVRLWTLFFHEKSVFNVLWGKSLELGLERVPTKEMRFFRVIKE